jgi:uncharacterized protein YfeS
MALDFTILSSEKIPLKWVSYYLDVWEVILPLARSKGLTFLGTLEEYSGPQADKVIQNAELIDFLTEINLIKNFIPNDKIDAIDFIRNLSSLVSEAIKNEVDVFVIAD